MVRYSDNKRPPLGGLYFLGILLRHCSLSLPVGFVGGGGVLSAGSIPISSNKKPEMASDNNRMWAGAVRHTIPIGHIL